MASEIKLELEALELSTMLTALLQKQMESEETHDGLNVQLKSLSRLLMAAEKWKNLLRESGRE